MINVIGLGCLGLHTVLTLARNGQNIDETDYGESLIKKLNNNQLTFGEDWLTELFESAVEKELNLHKPL